MTNKTTPVRLLDSTVNKWHQLQESGLIPASSQLDHDYQIADYITDQFERLIKAKREQEQNRVS